MVKQCNKVATLVVAAALFLSGAEAYHGILGPGCGPNWFPGPAYPAEPCFHCPNGRCASRHTSSALRRRVGRSQLAASHLTPGALTMAAACSYSSITGKQGDGTYSGLAKCTLDSCAASGFPSDGSCVCGCPGSFSVISTGNGATTSCDLCPTVRASVPQSRRRQRQQLN
jgi:hypothetical protein